MVSDPGTEGRLKSALADRYRIQREIGSGGMATVYLAEDLKHHRDIAIKVLKPGLAEALGPERFLREIEVAARLTHPHILPLHDSGEASGFLYYVMPYMEGESLRARLNREAQLPVDEAVQVARELGDALAYAHEKGVIHRDVKPANILLEGGHAVLADFGVAQAVADADPGRLTQTGISIGTPTYMSPEQASGERDLDGRSDQYALGCVLFEMLAGHAPFFGVQADAVLRQHLTVAAPDVTQFRPTVPAGVTEALGKALSKVPADRFSSTAEFGRVLATELQTPPKGTPSVSGKKRKLWWAVGAVAVVVAVLVGMSQWPPWAGEDAGSAAAGPAPLTILAEVEGSAPESLRKSARRLLLADLDASGVVEPLSDDAIRRGLERALLPDTTRLDLRVAKELAERARIQTVVGPELTQFGEDYVLTARVHFTQGDSLLVTKRYDAEGEDALLQASRSLVDSLRPALTEWAGGEVVFPREDPPITGSMEAYRLLEGLGPARERGNLMERARTALEIDPEFAEAWRLLGAQFLNAGFADSAANAWQEALKYPERLSPYHREVMQARLDGDDVARFGIEERRYRERGRASLRYTNALADIMDRYQESVAVQQEREDQSPFGLSSISYWNWASYLLALGRVEEAREVAGNLVGTEREVPVAAKIAMRDGLWEEAESLALEILRDPTRDTRRRSDAFWVIGSARAAQGRVRDAAEAFREMISLNQTAGRWYDRDRSQLNLLILTMAAELDPGPWLLEDLRADTTPRAKAVSGLWAAELGDTVGLKSSLSTLSPYDLAEFDRHSAQDALAAALASRLAGLRGEWGEASRLLEPVTEVRAPRPLASTPVPNWIRAVAEEGSGRLESAAHLYGWIAEGSRIGFDDVMGHGLTYSFAHRKAALLYGQLEDRDKAIEHWRAFLEAFTQPDPDFEWMVEEARAALERLEG